MLEITIPGQEYFNEEKQEFFYDSAQNLLLEHSLVSISKWESKWCKPFLDGKEKSPEEIIDYVRCMTINKNVKDKVYSNLTDDNLKSINTYIENSMTATTFRNDNSSSGGREIITSELIYYWMVAYNIPFECEKWHLNRLLTLVRICNVKNNPPKKMSKQEVINRNRELNKSRRQQLNSNG